MASLQTNVYIPARSVLIATPVGRFGRGLQARAIREWGSGESLVSFDPAFPNVSHSYGQNAFQHTADICLITGGKLTLNLKAEAAIFAEWVKVWAQIPVGFNLFLSVYHTAYPEKYLFTNCYFDNITQFSDVTTKDRNRELMISVGRVESNFEENVLAFPSV